MSVFITLLQQMIPLYGIIIVGYIAGKYLAVKKDSIARILLYVLTPAVIFNGILTSNITLSLLSIPILSCLLCTIVALITLFAASLIWKDGTKNMLSVGIANGNFGFLGLPLTILLLGQKYAALTALFMLGAAVFIATVGMFIAARTHYNLRESMLKVVRMPLIYAFLLGLLLNMLKVPINNSIMQALNNMNGAYSTLGLMLVGIAMSELGEIKIEPVLMIFTIIMTYILWPLITFGVILLDKSIFMFYNADIYRTLLLMSIVPVGATIVAISTELKVQPEKASFVVILTTVISLIYIPAFTALGMENI
jgi:malate permease and related proteins